MALQGENFQDEIVELITNDPIDLQKFHSLSRQKDGFVDSSTRRRIWPKLLGISKYDIIDYRKYVRQHRDTQQVICDVERSLWNLKDTSRWTKSFMHRRREALLGIILATLCRNEKLYYYQGT